MRANIMGKNRKKPEMNSLKSRMQEVLIQMYEDIAEEGLQPVLNDYVYV